MYNEAKEAFKNGDQEEAFLRFSEYHKSWTGLEESGVLKDKNGSLIIDEGEYRRGEEQQKESLWMQDRLLRELRSRYRDLGSSFQSPHSMGKEKPAFKGNLTKSQPNTPEAQPVPLHLAQSLSELQECCLKQEKDIAAKFDAAELLKAYDK